MITRLNLSCIARVYPYEYRAFSEAYDTFCSKYSNDGELAEQSRFMVNAATNPDYRVDDEDDAKFVQTVKAIIKRFATDGIRVFPAVLDTETQFELFFGVENPSDELLALMGDKVLTEEYDDSDEVFVAW